MMLESTDRSPLQGEAWSGSHDGLQEAEEGMLSAEQVSLGCGSQKTMGSGGSTVAFKVMFGFKFSRFFIKQLICYQHANKNLIPQSK